MSRQFDFQNLDLYSCQDFDNLRVVSSEPLKTLVGTADPTDVSSINNEEEFLYQKSTHMPSECFQISFEKDFMKEHQAVFERQLKNYMESFRIYSNKMSEFVPFSTQLHSKSQNESLTCSEFIKTHEFGISPQQTQKFVNKLNTFDKLSEFLNNVVKCCPEKIAIELIQLAKELLEKYQEAQLGLPTQGDLLNAAEDISRCPQFVELINLKEISLKKCKEATSLIESSKKFLQVYCATTMLVIAQYFENPYSSEVMGCFKRQLSPWRSEDDDEEEEGYLSSTPAKKRKFSF